DENASMVMHQVRVNDDRRVRVYGVRALDIDTQQLLEHGIEVELQQSDWAILTLLAAADNATVSSADLLCAVWGDDLCDDLTFLDTWIQRLNDRLGADRTGRPIIVAPSGGYRLLSPEEWRDGDSPAIHAAG
ncbi:MAG: winged helix-turn-helix domain-containing protein, partial [Vicinamibacterales bacterium]